MAYWFEQERPASVSTVIRVKRAARTLAVAA
jgi:hypothetical protein